MTRETMHQAKPNNANEFTITLPRVYEGFDEWLDRLAEKGDVNANAARRMWND